MESEEIEIIDDEPEPEAHLYCSVDCPCGHWNDRLRRPRPSGRRGKPNLDVVEGNRDAAR